MAGHIQNRTDMHTEFYWESVKQKDHLEDSGTEGRIKLKLILHVMGMSGVD